MHTLHHFFDTHAPVTKHIQKRKEKTPWFTLEILEAKREGRGAEQAWRKSSRTVHKRSSHRKKDAVTRLVLKAKIDYLNEQVAESHTSK